jgi:hypothetical protein
MRQELIAKEKAGIVKIPQKKRFSKLETEASCVVRRTGVKVEWSKSKVFTEAMIAQCFEKYGEIDKVVVEGNEAFVVFRKEMASVRGI